MLIDPSGSQLGLERHQLPFLGVSYFPTQSGSSPAQCIKRVTFPSAVSTCVHGVLPDPEGLLFSLSVSCQMCLLVCVSIGDKAGQQGSVPGTEPLLLLFLAPRWAECCCSGLRQSQSVTGSDGASVRTEGCTFPWGFRVSPGCTDGEQRLRWILGAGLGLLGGGSSSAQVPVVLAHPLRLVRASHPLWCSGETRRAAHAPRKIQAVPRARTNLEVLMVPFLLHSPTNSSNS